jgi:hypothetical protein
MTLLTEPTRIVLAQTYTRPDDADAVAYIAAVEAADGQALETATRMAINSFVKGCKNDGIWNAIKASCILAGARTLSGALIPLAGTAPTNFNFVDGDYNRKTGLVGDGSTKYLDSNRNSNADPQDSNHQSVFVSTAQSVGSGDLIGAGTGSSSGATHIGVQVQALMIYFFRSRNTLAGTLSVSAASTGLVGISRASSSGFSSRAAGASAVSNTASQTPFNGNVLIFNRVTTTGFTDARLAFYSIGEAIDLALLDARVTTLINAFAAAIP